MEWQEDCIDAEEEQDLKGAFTLIREAPAALTSGKQKAQQKERASGVAEATRALLLGAFPPLFKGEPEAQRLARAAAARRCWEHLEQGMQDTLDGTDAGVFEQLLSFARENHQAPGAVAAEGLQPEQLAGWQRVPTALVLAGGVNSADHCATFPSLAAFLRERGCYVALLQPHSCGKGAGDAVREVVRQLSGLADTRAQDWGALVQWYQDETAGGAAGSQASIRAEQAAAREDASAEDAEGSGAGAEGRQLRQRAAGGVGAAAVASAQQVANRQRPLVLVIEGTESVDVEALRSFVVTVSEGCPEVPLTLVLGLTTNAAALGAMLPSELTDRCMAMQHFTLASAISRLNSLVTQVLLGGSGKWPGLLFSSAITDRLVDTFLDHYYSTGCVKQGLRVAALAHFQSQPTSFLAAAALDGPAAVLEACSSLDAATLAEVRRGLGGRTAAQLAEAVTGAMAGWSAWAVGVHWLVLTAEAVGVLDKDFQPWSLLRDALLPDFASKQLPDMLARLAPKLRQLQPAAVQQLAAALQQRAAAVWGGEDAAAEQLERLAAVASSEGQRDEQGPPEQHVDEEQQDEEQPGAAQAAEPAQGAEQQEQQQQQGKKGKKDRFHSKASRKEALIQKAAAAKGGSGAAAATAAALGQEAAGPGAQLAGWLGPALRALLGGAPFKLPGAAPFLCRNATSLDCLTAEPRLALHLALTEPHHFLPGLPEDLGVTGTQEDACLAYRLFDQDPNCVNVADWYEAFAAVHAHANSAAGSGKAGNRRAAVKKAKSARQQGGDSREAGGSGEAAAAAEQAAEAVRLQRELAARFSQATAELQYVGLIKPAKRRRGDYVQRVLHMPAAER